MGLDQFRLDGKVAIVTGAGRGIGAATATLFAEAGADLVIGARTEEQLAVARRHRDFHAEAFGSIAEMERSKPDMLRDILSVSPYTGSDQES